MKKVASLNPVPEDPPIARHEKSTGFSEMKAIKKRFPVVRCRV